MAVTEAAVAIELFVFGAWSAGIVLAIDSAKIPPPQPTSRYFNPRPCSLSGGASARQVATKSWRSGFIKCRTRDGPIGSHQLLASEEKCDSSFAETDEVEWLRVVVLRTVTRVRTVGRRGGIFACPFVSLSGLIGVWFGCCRGSRTVGALNGMNLDLAVLAE